MNKRLLLVTNTLAWGGAETQVIDLALRFQARGWKVAVAVLVRNAERRDALELAGIEVHTLGMARGVPDIRAIWRLRRLVKDFRPDVVHSHVVHANLLCRVTRLVVDMPVLISSAHSVNEGGRWREIAYRLTDRLTDITTNVSTVAVERSIAVGAVPAHRIRLMPNGIDASRFRHDSKVRDNVRRQLGIGSRFAWLAVGRIDPSKDYGNLIRAFARVKVVHESALLLIVGDGPLRGELEAYIRREALSDSVRLLGTRGDVPELMNVADAYVMSSAWEGMPMVLLEAAAAGLPIVATNVGGNAQIVRHGESGELVPPGDSAALGDAMIRVMGLSEEGRLRWGEAGTEHVRRTFDMDEIVARWERLYIELSEAHKV